MAPFYLFNSSPISPGKLESRRRRLGDRNADSIIRKKDDYVSDSWDLNAYNTPTRQTSFCMEWRGGRYGFDAGNKAQGACRDDSQSR